MIATTLLPLLGGDISKGEKIFLAQCWGCHHQTAEAFGPSFQKIARLRSQSQIKGQIIRPDLLYKELGYRRNAMPAFPMNGDELEDITAYIESFR